MFLPIESTYSDHTFMSMQTFRDRITMLVDNAAKHAGIDLFMEHNKNRKDGKDVGGRPKKEADEANTLAATLRTNSELRQKGFSPRIMVAAIANSLLRT